MDVPAAGGPVAGVVPHGSVEAVCDLLVLGGEVDGRVGEGGDDFLGGREPHAVTRSRDQGDLTQHLGTPQFAFLGCDQN